MKTFQTVSIAILLLVPAWERGALLGAQAASGEAVPADAGIRSDSGTAAASMACPPIALLYHTDPDTRLQAVHALAATRDLSLIDDLVRACSVEFYTPVHNAYADAFRRFANDPSPRGPGEWKAWLNEQVAAGRLKLDYLPITPAALDPAAQQLIQPFAFKLGPEHFDAMAAALTNRDAVPFPSSDALRYMVANDHLPVVQAFLGGPWLELFLSVSNLPGAVINSLAYQLNGLANPGPARDPVNARIRRCLDSTNSTVVANALRMLAGVEGFSTRFLVPGAADKVRSLLDYPDPKIAADARRALERADPAWAAAQVSYDEAFRDLYDTLGRNYPCFSLKGIDWERVGHELLPRAATVQTAEEFGLLCLELVARLEDSHAYLMPGTARVPAVPFPQWDPGFGCLIGDAGRPVVYHVDRGSPAADAGLAVGMTVLSINGISAEEQLESLMRQTRKYVGYSSERYLRYHTAQWLGRQAGRGAVVTLEVEPPDDGRRTLKMAATLGVRYLPRLPVPVPGIRDSGDVSWTRLTHNIGYIYVRRIGANLVSRLDEAVGDLRDARGLIVDVRGNSGGAFDAPRAHRNFALTDDAEPGRPRFRGPMALLIDARCISAGEGWASWFIAQRRARVFGETTAGASSRKTVYTLRNGLFKVQLLVKAYTGFLDRPIERRGLEPDVPLRPNAKDLAAGRDTVLEAARRFLEGQPLQNPGDNPP